MLDSAVWSVGNGDLIRPFLDPWIPGRYGERLRTQPVTQVQARTIFEEWINPINREWCEDRIRAALITEEVETVMQVPIPVLGLHDELRWPHERQGRVTVRSAYHHIRGRDRDDSGAAMGRGRETNMWDAIWKSSAQPKVKAFAWRLISNAVAVRDRLCRRGMQVPSTCPLCTETETVEHLI